MFKVVLRSQEKSETREFADKGIALDCALRMLSQYGPQSSLYVESEGGVVFNQADIVRTFEMVRP